MRRAIKLALPALCVLSTGQALAQQRSATPRPARVQSQEGIAIGGNVEQNSTLIVGTPADKLKEIVAAGDREWRDLTESQQAELLSLQRQFGVTLGALQAFFAALGEHDVPEEQLAVRLGEMAGRFKHVGAGVMEIAASSPAVAALKAEAQTALDSGQLDEADDLLARMQDFQRGDIAGALSDLSTIASQRGDLAVAQLRYLDAAEHFANAARFAPGQESRTRYLRAEADVLYRHGLELGALESLDRSIVRWRELARLLPREHLPLDWAAAQHGLGNALQALGGRETGTARLLEAAAAYRAALSERLRERVPLEWAQSQNSLGNVLVALGTRVPGTTLLEEAVGAFLLALEERKRERTPLDWAATQHNLGNALGTIGERETGTKRLEEAIAAYRQALLETPRERVPLDWASTQHTLGSTLLVLGLREGGTARIEDAIVAYQLALEERTSERVPFHWATTRLSRCRAEVLLAERTGNSAALPSLEVQAQEARAVLVEGGHERGISQGDYVLSEIERVRAKIGG
jgi:tetratricopeptide (TPR) repeat protein